MTWLLCIVSNTLLASLLASLAWFAQRILRQHSVARVLWVLALLKLLTPPLVPVSLGRFSGAVACTIGTCACGPHGIVQTFLQQGLPWVLLVVWSTGAVVTAWTAWSRWANFRRLLAHARPIPPDWRSVAERLCSDLSLRARPELFVVPGRLPPFVLAGRAAPRLYLPSALLALDGTKREALLLHELAHLQRRDHWVRGLEVVVHVAYWWLPAVGSIGRQMRDCEEAFADDVVVAHLPHARREYASLLLDVVDFLTPECCSSVPSITAMSAARDLERRLGAILKSRPAARRSRWTGWGAVALSCLLLPCELSARPTTSAEKSSVRETSTGPGAARANDPNAKNFQLNCCPS